MSGGAVAYHLRENKAIERNLFIDLLSRVGRFTNISNYTYIGFGGPFLEDIKSLHAALRINKMISIESDENVWYRQVFNCPAKFVDLRHGLSGEFIRSYDFSGHYVVWLDYTSPKDIYQQLSEFRLLVGRLGYGDIVKITLNANASALGGNGAGAELHTARRVELEKRLGDYCPADLQDENVMGKGYPETLLKAAKKSLKEFATRASGEYFQLLSSFVYKDSGHSMLTITGIVLNAKDGDDRARFLNNTRLDHWPFVNLDWASPTEISVPTLSTKERMRLDEVLPLAVAGDPGAFLEGVLGYSPSQGEDNVRTQALLANYARFYRSYPLFSRVIL